MDNIHTELIRMNQDISAEYLKLDKVVLFYEMDHYYLSNFSAFRVQHIGHTWETVEKAYHAARFKDFDDNLVDQIDSAMSSHDAFKLAQNNLHRQNPNWDNLKLGVMKEILENKIKIHEYVQTKIKQTLGWTLIEDSWRDSYWGRGPKWSGQNHLGKIWGKVRDEYFAVIE